MICATGTESSYAEPNSKGMTTGESSTPISASASPAPPIATESFQGGVRRACVPARKG